MMSLLKHKRIHLVYLSIISALIVFSRCISNNTNQQKPETEKTPELTKITYNQFAGSQSCAGCHAAITDNYFHTAHFYSSQTASAESIKGSFKKGENNFKYDVGKIVSLEKKQDSFYQTYYYKNKKVVSRKFDIVIGSGTKGQTYLSWLDDHLIELPVSYFTQIHQWANSPGYPLNPIIFNRPVTARCMECHSTYAQVVNYNSNVPPVFDSSKMIVTIGCERCHGPAAKHVAYQQQYPNDNVAKFIINPKKLSRQLSLNVCAVCHAGRLQETQQPFSFQAGDNLSDFFAISDAAKKAGVMDVHGNQLNVLSASKCFRRSQTMTCITCHDTHINERGSTKIFSQRCISCHSNRHKTIEGISNEMLAANCIDCHMPLQESTSISFLLKKDKPPVNALMRTHFITIYNDETKKFIEHITSSQKKKS